MKLTVPPIAAQAREHDKAFQLAFQAARESRGRLVTVRPHRSFTPLKMTPWLIAQAVVLPLVFCALLFWARPMVFEWWRACILFWSDGLGLPFVRLGQAGAAGQAAGMLSGGTADSPQPGFVHLMLAAAATLALLGLSLRMKGASLPLKYPLRIVCVVQAVALAYFWWVPSGFPYSISRHSEELMTIGYAVMLATPIMLAIGYYILNVAVHTKIFRTLAILAFLAVLVPHQVLAQAFLLQHLSVVVMPVLYICMGAVFDAMVFVALYSWAVSDVSPEAAH
ncbi:MAG: hypothetical protein ABW051_07610 [Burkholderiaceae bacterium]